MQWNEERPWERHGLFCSLVVYNKPFPRYSYSGLFCSLVVYNKPFPRYSYSEKRFLKSCSFFIVHLLNIVFDNKRLEDFGTLKNYFT